MGLNESVLDFQPGSEPEKETVANTPVIAGVYYLTQRGVNPETLELYAGNTELTITTHYTFDSDTSAVTITSAGATALTGVALTAVYEYSSLGKDMEAQIEEKTGCVFANQSDGSGYLQITDELLAGKGAIDSFYNTEHYPIIKLQTTVADDYTTGSTTLNLVDASGFPSSGTIYIGGNKVKYTSKTLNALTVPSGTPSIDEGAVVRGEVIEVSTSPGGASPSYIILEPDTDYAIDYDTGMIQILSDFYHFADIALSTPQDGLMDRLRLNYMHAWHGVGKPATVPANIEEVVYMLAGRHVIQRTILKANAGQRDNFNAQSYGFSKEDIDEIIRNYTMYRNSNV